jgi:hypothetical protein
MGAFCQIRAAASEGSGTELLTNIFVQTMIIFK